MKRIVLIAIALAVICSENGYARTKDGGYYLHGIPDCRGFLEGYATAKFEGPDTVTASSDFHKYTRWVFGYISAYNEYVDNRRSDVLKDAKMTANDTRRWLGAWCRDNISRDLYDAVKALIFKIDDDFTALRK